MPALFGRIERLRGSIDIPRLGAPVAEIVSATLSRRSKEGPESDLYDLHATLSGVNAALFNDPEYEKRVIVRLGKQAWLLEPQEGPGQRTALAGRSLIMERVKLCQPRE